MKKILFLFAIFYMTEGAAQKQLKNGGFEKWKDTLGYHIPDGWSVHMIAAMTHSPSDSSKEGRKAVVLSTWYSYVPGYFFYGNHANPDHRQWTNYTVPFSGKPASLKGWYRYTHPVNPDDKAAGSILLKDNAGDTLAYGQIFFISTTGWSSFEIPLLYYSQKPVKNIAVYFTSVVNRGGMNDDNYPNRLYLDGLTFVYKKEKKNILLNDR